MIVDGGLAYIEGDTAPPPQVAGMVGSALQDGCLKVVEPGGSAAICLSSNSSSSVVI